MEKDYTVRTCAFSSLQKTPLNNEDSFLLLKEGFCGQQSFAGAASYLSVICLERFFGK